MRDNYHILPVEDLKPHIESGLYCHCEPEVRNESDGNLVIHNAYDGREFYENDKEEEVEEINFHDSILSGDYVGWEFETCLLITNLDKCPIT